MQQLLVTRYSMRALLIYTERVQCVLFSLRPGERAAHVAQNSGADQRKRLLDGGLDVQATRKTLDHSQLVAIHSSSNTQ
jgi:hypothetical protein